MKNTGRKQRALEAYQQVLEIYPMMRSAQGEVATLSEELAGEGINACRPKVRSDFGTTTCTKTIA